MNAEQFKNSLKESEFMRSHFIMCTIPEPITNKPNQEKRAGVAANEI